MVSLDLANAVRSAIEDDMQSEKGAGHMWRKGATRFAIAASVALAVVTGVQWQQQKTAVSGQLAAVPSPALNRWRVAHFCNHVISIMSVIYNLTLSMHRWI